MMSLSGCSLDVLEPRGPVGESERQIFFNALAIMLFIAVPVILGTFAVAFFFRASNESAPYWPDWCYSGRLEFIIWSVPALAVMFLGAVAWVGSHALDPRKPLEGRPDTLEIDVVSLDWKWLFIYPEAQVASVNDLAMPVDRPVKFRLTSASVMNSFLIPRLGSQIYCMAGMETGLYLKASQPGDYAGISAQFSGDGFTKMRFTAHALDATAFDAWIAQAKRGEGRLDAESYRELLRPGVSGVRAYGGVDKGFFDAVLTQSAARPERQAGVVGAPICQTKGQ
jgi:cytochrome o ubiquinol oxidase subunit 2